MSRVFTNRSFFLFSLVATVSFLKCAIWEASIARQSRVVSENPLRTLNAASLQDAGDSSSLQEGTITETFNSSDVEVTTTTTSSKPSCWRHCPGNKRINRIVWRHHHAKGAGILDRVYVLRRLINLAGYLCAVVEAPGPTWLLAAMHNNNKRLDPDSTWDDFRNFTFLPDQQPSVRSFSFIDRPRTYFEDECRQGMFENFTCLRSVTSRDFSPEFKQAEAIALAQTEDSTTGFIWEYHEEFYEWYENLRDFIENRQADQIGEDLWRMRPDLSEFETGGGCIYYSDEMPGHLQEIADGIWNRILDESGAKFMVGVLHVRRGDTMYLCDTTLKKMEQYIDCTFNNTEHLGPVALLFASDEKDARYRRKIHEMVAKFSHVKFFDVDAMIWKAIRNAVNHGAPARRLNNYYQYSVVEELKSRVTFLLEQRKQGFCPQCSDIRK